MKTPLKTAFLISFLCAATIGQGQLMADSCGLDVNPFLNKHEIKFIDSLFFKPIHTKKGVIDPKRGFDLAGKKIAFYSCTVNANKGKGILSKQQFFSLIKPTPAGHAGRGIIPFTPAEKAGANGFDAVIVIDCPYDNIDMKKLIAQLLDFNKQ